MRAHRRTAVLAACIITGGLAAAGPPVAPALAQPAGSGTAALADHRPGGQPKQPVAVGYGGAVATVDLDASKAGIEVLKHGGNAVDAAVAAAATLGVTEPYSAGIGGGGFFVYYQADTHQVFTLDGRETAPAAMGPTAFIENGLPLPVADAVTSGLSVGVPGTLATWDAALQRWGKWSLDRALQPAIDVADRGFTVDATFQAQTAQNAARFAHFTSTAALYLPGGQPPVVGSTLRNPDLADTYRQLAAAGPGYFYTGPLAGEIVGTVQHPPLVPGDPYYARPGLMTTPDLAAYRVIPRDPTRVKYAGVEIDSMAPPSSGGTTVGESLNILSHFPLSGATPAATVQSLHYYLESTRLAFADRNRYVGDPDQVSVPTWELLSPGFAAERACQINPLHAATSPVPPGTPDGDYQPCAAAGPVSKAAEPYEGPNTSSLVTADRWGNVVSYTLTIEQTGGSGIVLPGRGFLLNNELTDFNFAPTQGTAPDPNLPAPGKRPRSSMSPTIVLRDGGPFLALGSPGGATIITTVLQTLVNRLNLGMSLPAAIAAPRASQRNRDLNVGADAEPAFLAQYGSALAGYGQLFVPNPEIGATVGLEFLGQRQLLAAAEPVRRGGGSALVLLPAR